jgi:hypothetical protein
MKLGGLQKSSKRERGQVSHGDTPASQVWSGDAAYNGLADETIFAQ